MTEEEEEEEEVVLTGFQHLTPSVNHDGHVRVKRMSSKHNVKIPTTRLHAAQQAPYDGRGLRVNTVERAEKTDIIQQSGIPDSGSGSMQNCIPDCCRLKSSLGIL